MYRFESADAVIRQLADTHAKRVTCPVCAAVVGEPCRREGFRPHVARTKKANKTEYAKC
jgi:hypothetical protein